ncbi:MAG: CDP-glucose 4,6-dehydratase [Gammaproteobacteria bacterium]|nr:CDP-glucose 4,6-dehydratase [Gammaproteobacteria bacterium]
MHVQFWKNKKVFLTGHTGFKGSWLALWLTSLGAKVTGYALAPATQPSLFELAQIESCLNASVIADIRDLASLKKAVQDAQPDIIFHLAAQPLVRYSYTNPVETYETNVMGTVHVLEAMRASSTAKVLVNVTTDKCYENKEWHLGYKETDPMGGYDPYSSSKGCAELVTSAYRASYFNPNNCGLHGKSIASARAGNVIGGGDWALDRLIPDIITAFQQHKKPIIRYPHAIRPWQHVLEPLSGYMRLAEKCWNAHGDYAEAWNFGPRDEDCVSVEWIANKLSQLWGNGAAWEDAAPESLHEAHILKLDISKAKTRLDWQPQWNLTQALVATVEWYQGWINNSDTQALTLQQIKSYTHHLEKAYA